MHYRPLPIRHLGDVSPCPPRDLRHWIRESPPAKDRRPNHGVTPPPSESVVKCQLTLKPTGGRNKHRSAVRIKQTGNCYFGEQHILFRSWKKQALTSVHFKCFAFFANERLAGMAQCYVCETLTQTSLPCRIYQLTSPIQFSTPGMAKKHRTDAFTDS